MLDACSQPDALQADLFERLVVKISRFCRERVLARVRREMGCRVSSMSRLDSSSAVSRSSCAALSSASKENPMVIVGDLLSQVQDYVGEIWRASRWVRGSGSVSMAARQVSRSR